MHIPASNYNNNCSISKPVPIYADTGKVVGSVVGDTFRKTVIGSQHFLRQPPAIASDVSALMQAERAGAAWVEVLDKETKTIYRATIELIRTNGLEIKRGYGKQLALPMAWWTKTINGKPVQPSHL